MERIYFNNDYIIIADNKLGNDFRCESILKSLSDLNNENEIFENGITNDKTKDKINQNITKIMNLGINDMFNKLFDCEYG